LHGGNAMRNKTILLGLMMLLITGMAGLNVFWPEHNRPRKEQSLLPARDYRKVEGVFNKKEGWGFVKAKNGRGPEVTAHQRSLVKQYNALFTGDTAKKQVTITFDMGYEKESLTPKILEILQKNKVKASFFVTTHWIESNPQIAGQVIKDGHFLMNHTVKHKSLPTLSDEEIKDEILGWESVARQVAGYKSVYKYMRPPMGEYSERSLKITKELGYRTAFWSVAIRDWLPMGGPQAAVIGITGQLHNGAVILLHGNSEDSVNGLEEIIIQTQKKGYKIVPIYQI